MDLDRLKNVLNAVSEKNCNKDNIIEEIKQESQRRYFDFYQEWKRNSFDIDYRIFINHNSNVIQNITLSHLAIDCERENIVDLLIENGASVNAVKSEYSSEYSYVLSNHSTDAHPANEIIDGYSLLHSAVKSNCERLAKFLISKNADINLMAMNGYTPLHFAANNGNENIVNFLIQHNANINTQVVKYYGFSDDVLFTPLHLAAYNGHHNIIEILIKNGANPLLKDLKDKIPRALTEDKEIIEFLKKAESKYLFKQSTKLGLTYGSIAALVPMIGCVGAKSNIAIIFTTIVSIACLGVMKFSKKAEISNQSMKSGLICGSASILSVAIRGAGASVAPSAATTFAAAAFAVGACIAGGIKYFANKPSSELNETNPVSVTQPERALFP